MKIHEIFQRKKTGIHQLMQGRRTESEPVIVTCPQCGSSFSEQTLRRKRKICTGCGWYFPMTPQERVHLLADKKTFRRYEGGRWKNDPLAFPGYSEKLQDVKEKNGTAEAAVTGVLEIHGITVAVGILDTRVFMGSMGAEVGEKITGITELAMKKKLPLLIFSASGGARMQEGIISLMQMAKTSAAIEKFRQKGGLYLSVLCHPTMGGVSASFAFLGDMILAEPGALIGFAGPRVIQQTIKEELPEGFQRAESQMEHGMLDLIVERKNLRETIFRILKLHGYQGGGKPHGTKDCI